MTDGLFAAGAVLVPLSFGLVPGFLPRTTPIGLRLALWLAVAVAAGLWLGRVGDAPVPFRELALAFVLLAAMLSLLFLVTQAVRERARRRRSQA